MTPIEMNKIIRGGTLIDGTGNEPLENAEILIEGSRIKAVGREGEFSRQDGELIEAFGLTIMPGLIECHAHITLSGEPDIKESMSQPLTFTVLRATKSLRACIEAGYTTVRDCGGIEGIDIALKRAVELGLVSGPRLYVSGRAISITGGHGDFDLPDYGIAPPHSIGTIANGVDEVRKAAREQLKAGADWIKLMSGGGLSSPETTPIIAAPQFSVDEIKAACEVAHFRGNRVCAHAISDQSIRNALMGNVDTIEHGVLIDKETIEQIKERNRFLVFGSITAVKAAQTRGIEAGIPEYNIRKMQEFLPYTDMQRKLLSIAQSGIRLVPGSDAGCPLNKHGENAEELRLWVEAGLSPMEAIVATTKTAAEALGLEDSIGTIEPRKLADILIIDGDPLKDIRVLRDKGRIRRVMKNGNVESINEADVESD